MAERRPPEPASSPAVRQNQLQGYERMFDRRTDDKQNGQRQKRDYAPHSLRHSFLAAVSIHGHHAGRLRSSAVTSATHERLNEDAHRVCHLLSGISSR